MTGDMEKVFPFDIFPMQLIKSIMVEDIDAMEQLGIYEVDEEDFALIEYIDTSKIDIILETGQLASCRQRTGLPSPRA